MSASRHNFEYTGPEQWLIDHAKHGQQRYVCPWCGPHRRKKGEETLATLRDDTSIKYKCHHCPSEGIIVLERRGTVLSFESPKPIARKKREEFDGLGDSQLDWLSARGISASTAFRYELIGDEIFGKPIVGFPYYDEKGNVVAVKQRFVEDKKFTCWQSPQSFFGIRHINKGDDLVIVEGEMDVLAMAEAGVKAISVPNGAPMKVTEGRIDPTEDGKFKFLWAAKDYIDAAKRIVIATDSDGPGEALAEEIARRIGKERCWRIKFPEGIKDSNDLLLKSGASALKKSVDTAEPWPVRGLYDAEHFRNMVEELYSKGIGRGESTGYENVDEFYTIVPGQITIVTGIPSSGKSEFIDQVMVNLAANRGWKFGICSFENEPRLHIAKLMSKRAHRPFFEGYHRRMDPHEFKAAFDFVNDHFTFVHQDDGSLADLDSILDRLRVSVLRHGIRGAVIDPYNFISRDRSDKSETEWISDMLTKVKAFAMAHGIHIWFVAHPTKLQKNLDGRIPPPGGYDISGCYDEKTEVLTTAGWVPHASITEEHHVAVFDSLTGKMRYEKPQLVHAYPYEGLMHHWSGAALDIMVTPNHRMVAKRKPEDAWGFVKSEDITAGRWYFPSAAGAAPGVIGDEIGIDLGYSAMDLMWYLGFWVAEGCVQANSLSVCQAVDQHHIPKAVMDRLGFVYTDAVSNGRFNEKQMWTARLQRRWHIDLIDTVIQSCGVGARNKRVPDFIWGMGVEAKSAFLDGYWYGDGTTKNNSRESLTISRALADDIQRLAIECGYYATMRADYASNENWSDRYVVTWRKQDCRSVQIDRNLSMVPYSGMVYCLTVSTGAYVTRRNGRVAYQGNSAAWFAKADCGLTVHREKDDPHVAQIHIWKCRFSWVGKQGQANLVYDVGTTCYAEVPQAESTDGGFEI